MKKRVFIIHGWGGSPEGNWFPWMKTELKKHGFNVSVPQLPNTDFPKQEEWLSCMHEIISNTDENTYLIGHSLGVIAILRFLESFSAGQKIGGAIFVSGFSEDLGTIVEIENFFTDSVNYEKIKSCCKNFVIINSNNDPYVPLEKGNFLYAKLGAKFIILEKAGHIMASDGFTQLPIAVEELLRISK